MDSYDGKEGLDSKCFINFSVCPFERNENKKFQEFLDGCSWINYEITGKLD